MASPNIYSSGVGGTSGATLATLSPLFCSGVVWYVHSPTGSDAAAPRGKERIRPLATLAQAYTNASAGDIIVFLAGHSETLSVSQAIAKARLILLGEGSGITRPQFTRNANIALLDVTAAGVIIDNLYFPESTFFSATGRVRFQAADCVLRNCYMLCGANDANASIYTMAGASGLTIEDTFVISTSTTPATAPARAVNVANSLSDFTINRLTVDGGVSGWLNDAIEHTLGAITGLKATNVDLLGDSDVTILTGSTGYFHVRNTTGSARVAWAA